MDYERAGVAENYRRARALPDATMVLWRDTLRELVPAAGVAHVVDVGCGTGRFVGCLAEAFGARIIGVDPSTRMLAAAERHATARYVAGEAQALPLAASTFDVAFLSMVWHHLCAPGVAAVALGASSAVHPGRLRGDGTSSHRTAHDR